METDDDDLGRDGRWMIGRNHDEAVALRSEDVLLTAKADDGEQFMANISNMATNHKVTVLALVLAIVVVAVLNIVSSVVFATPLSGIRTVNIAAGTRNACVQEKRDHISVISKFLGLSIILT
jgi:hypothetical protein